MCMSKKKKGKLVWRRRVMTLTEILGQEARRLCSKKRTWASDER